MFREQADSQIRYFIHESNFKTGGGATKNVNHISPLKKWIQLMEGHKVSPNQVVDLQIITEYTSKSISLLKGFQAQTE